MLFQTLSPIFISLAMLAIYRCTARLRAVKVSDAHGRRRSSNLPRRKGFLEWVAHSW